jgi:hypothetical protein
MPEFIATVIITTEFRTPHGQHPRLHLEKALHEALEKYCAVPIHSVYVDTFHNVGTKPLPAGAEL